MVIEDLGRADIAEQHLHILVSRHLLHLGERGTGTRGLGEEPGAQRVAGDGRRIEPVTFGIALLNETAVVAHGSAPS